MADRREIKRMSKGELVDEVVKLRELLGSTFSGSATEINYESGVAMATGDPFVRFYWGRELAQLRPAEVRQMAVQLVETAAAAEFDAALVDLLTGERFGYTMEEAVAVLVLMRQERAKRGGPVMPGARPQDPEMRS